MGVHPPRPRAGVCAVSGAYKASELAYIDYETRSATSIKDGLDRYASDPQCEALMLAYKLPDQEPRQWHRGPSLDQDAPPPQDLFDYIAGGGFVSAFNFPFEYTIWNKVCVPKLGWPKLPVEQGVCTQAVAAAHNLPQSLGRVAAVLGLPQDAQKDKRGKYLIQRLCVPHKPTKARPGIWVEDPELYQEFLVYNAQDIVAEEAVARRLAPLTEAQRKMWIFTQKLNARGVPFAVDEAARLDVVVAMEKERLNKELDQLTNGEVPTATKRTQLLEWCNKRMADEGYFETINLDDPVDDEEDRPGHEEPIANLRGATVDAMLQKDLPDDVRRALVIRSQVCQTSTKKLDTIQRLASEDSRLRGLYVWHGAGTGRFASRGYNAQNIPRSALGDQDLRIAHEIIESIEDAGALHSDLYLHFGDGVMDVASSSLRGMIKAGPGKVLIDADLSNVEVRVAAWLAGQDDLVQAFRDGMDPYKVFGSRMFKVPYDQVTKEQRQFSKPPTLGGIFSLGAAGLVLYAASMNIRISRSEAEEAITTLRTEWHEIQKLWWACGAAILRATQNPGTVQLINEKLRVVVHRGFLCLELPSKRLLRWYAPRVENHKMPWQEKVRIGHNDQGEPVFGMRDVWREVVTVESIDVKTRQFSRHVLTGGSTMQSATQATAADILCEGAVNIEEAGYPVVMLTHDEVTAEVDEGFGSEAEFAKLLCAPSEWRMDLPLASETWKATRFRK